MHYAVWYGAVLRADLSEIHIGDETSIGDRTVISGSGTVKIGSRVSVGAGVAMQGGATLGVSAPFTGAVCCLVL